MDSPQPDKPEPKTIDQLVADLRACNTTHPGHSDEQQDRILMQIRKALTKIQVEQLTQLINMGPVHDGDVISKHTRGELINWGLAARVMVRGRWGYTAATYLGGHVLSDRINHLDLDQVT